MRIAVYTASQNLYPFLTGPLKSMIKNGKPDKVYLLLEHNQFIEDLPSNCEVINVSKQQWFVPGCCPNYYSQFTYLAMMRVVLTKVLPKDIDKVLSMDCDTIVQRDISELWDTDLDGYYLSATREILRTQQDGMDYFNTGVALYNLKAMREDHIDDALVDDLNKHRYSCMEQEALNKICRGHILNMPSKFNFCDYVPNPNEPECIRHYAGYNVHTWGYTPEVTMYRNMPWSDVLN